MRHLLKLSVFAVVSLIAVIASPTAIAQDATPTVGSAPSGTPFGEGAGEGHLRP